MLNKVLFFMLAAFVCCGKLDAHETQPKVILQLSKEFQAPEVVASPQGTESPFETTVNKGGVPIKHFPQRKFEDDIVRTPKSNPMDSPLNPKRDRIHSSYDYSVQKRVLGK